MFSDRLRKYASAAAAADGELRRPSARQAEDLARCAQRGSLKLRFAELQDDRRRDGQACACCNPGEHLRAHARRRHLDGEHRRSRYPLDLAERAHDHLGRGLTIESNSRLLRYDSEAETAPDERSVFGPAIHVVGYLVERVLERGVRDGEPGKHLGAEHARADATEASDGAEAVAGAAGGSDRGAPVGLDAELVRGERVRRVARDELDRVVGLLLEERVELRDRLALRQAADVDTGHLGSRCELALRAGEREADE